MSDRLASVFDLLVSLAIVAAATGLVLLEPLGGGVLRAVIVLPTLLFVPGYVLVSFLYPDAPKDPATRDKEGWSLTALERVGLSVAVSAALVPLLALVFNFTPLGVRPVPVMVGIAVVTTISVVGAAITRFRTPPEQRFRSGVFAWLASVTRTYFTGTRDSMRQPRPFEARTERHRVLNLLLVGAVVVLLASVAYGAVGPTLPSQNGQYTELYLLGSDGQHFLGSDQQSGSGSVPATIAIENHEQSRMDYTVVIQRQQVTVQNGRTRVESASVVDTVQKTVGDGGTAHIDRTFQGGRNVRVQVMLFKGAPPEKPTADDAYRVTRFWPSGGGGSGDS